VTDVFKLSLCHELSNSKKDLQFLTKHFNQIKEVIGNFNLSFRAQREIFFSRWLENHYFFGYKNQHAI